MGASGLALKLWVRVAVKEVGGNLFSALEKCRYGCGKLVCDTKSATALHNDYSFFDLGLVWLNIRFVWIDCPRHLNCLWIRSDC